MAGRFQDIASLFFCLVLLRLFTSTVSQESPCEEPLDLILLADSSLSIQDDGGSANWEASLQFLDTLTSRFLISPDHVRVAVASYSSRVLQDDVFYLYQANSVQGVTGQIHGMNFIAGNTNTSGALRFTRERFLTSHLGNRQYVTDVVVLITDGLSNVEKDHTFTESARLRHSGVQIFTVGVTPYVSDEELQEIASDPYSFYGFHAPDVQGLNRIVDTLASQICITSTPRTTPCVHQALDIAVIMDESGSITDKNPNGTDALHNWNIMKRFVVSFLDSLTLGPDAMQVAAITFSSKAKIAFGLGDTVDKNQTLQAVMDLMYHSGGTNTSGALRVAREHIFRPDRGDRPNVPNVIIIITDGESTVDANLTIREATLLKQGGTHIFAVGVTNQIDLNELTAIASPPAQDNIFLSVNIDRVVDLTSRLVFGICRLPNSTACQSQDCISQPPSRCGSGQRLTWHLESDHILMGHNERRLQSVDSVEQCQDYCLQDPLCRSLDYSQVTNECSISYTTKTDQMWDFILSVGYQYFEWQCI